MTQSILVIGGGLGGISAAIRMAQSGYKVTLFEQNNHIGGKVNRLEKQGFGFDLGPSILTMPYIFERLFNYSGKIWLIISKLKDCRYNGGVSFLMVKSLIYMKILKQLYLIICS